jgi:hypothetical protein
VGAKSVGHSFAILRGFATGNKKKAAEYLNSMSPEKLAHQNRLESRIRGRLKKSKYKLGRRPTIRRAV